MAKVTRKQKTQSENRIISVKELKFWLEGVLEMQASSWVPNAEQWKTIKDKIFNLEDITPAPMISKKNETYEAVINQNVFERPQIIRTEGGASGLADSTFPEQIRLPALPKANDKGFLSLSEEDVTVSGGIVRNHEPNPFA